MSKLSFLYLFTSPALFAASPTGMAAPQQSGGVSLSARGVYPPGIEPARSVAVFISNRMFGEEAFQIVTRRLEVKGFRPVIVARDTGIAVGMNQAIARPDVGLEDCRPEDYAALVVLNGSGIATLWQDSLLQTRIRRFNEAGRFIGGIGIGTICLAEAGVLEGRSATMLPDRRAVRRILARGARYRPNPVVTDRNIITAADTQYARRLTDVLIGMLEKRSGLDTETHEGAGEK